MIQNFHYNFLQCKKRKRKRKKWGLLFHVGYSLVLFISEEGLLGYLHWLKI